MENNSIKRLSGMIGLAMRAGKLTLGADMVCLAMQKKSRTSPRLIVLAQGASSATRERLIKKSAYYGVPLIEVPIDMGKLGQLLGKTYAPAVISVNDDGFAREIISIVPKAILNPT